MARIRVPISNFQYGEISPSLVSRTDTPLYNNSAKKIENFFLRNEGGLLKRFGTKRIYEFDTTVDSSATQQLRLVPFIFSDDERYIVSLESAKIRVFQISPTTGNVSLVQTLTQDVDSNAIPFTNAKLPELTYAQFGDVMFIAHQTFMVRKLVRTSLTTFELQLMTFNESADGYRINQPYYSFQDVGVTLDPSATTGNGITLTTSANYFNTGDVTAEDTAATAIANGTRYQIKTVGTTDFVTDFGADSNTVGVVFVANSAGDSGSGTGTVDEVDLSDHVGTVLRYHDNEIEIKTVISATKATGDVTDELLVHLDRDAIETTDGSSDIHITFANHGLSTSDSITISAAGAVGGISANNINGTRSVTEVIDENEFVVTAGASSNESTIGGGSPKIVTHAATTEWGEQSYSALRGYPGAVTFHENRLWLGGTLAQPDGIWASKSADYFNFDVGAAEDDDALDITASIGEINTIRHLVSNRDLQIFTSTSEMYIPSFTEKPITPTNAQVRRQTSYGANFVRPSSFDGATIYVQKTGSVVREYIYSDAEAAYVSTGISVLSPHLISSPVQMSILRGAINRPESYAFVLNDDGTLAVFTSNRAEQRAGWTQWTTSGKFHSVCTVDDRVFCIGTYDTGAGTDKHILMEFESTLNMDFSDDFTGTAGVFDVSSHFANGAKVKVVDDTNYLGEFTVTSGNVDVSAVQEITSAEIGFDFNVEAETLPLDAQVTNGPLTGEPRSVNRVVVDLLDTLSVSVNDKKLIIRTVTDDFSQDRVAVTGKREFRLLGYSKDPTVKITQTAPMSLQLNGIVAEVTF